MHGETFAVPAALSEGLRQATISSGASQSESRELSLNAFLAKQALQHTATCLLEAVLLQE